MPCAVDTANCGQIYFITWTKNVTSLPQPAHSPPSPSQPVTGPRGPKSANGEWERLYLHTFDSSHDESYSAPQGRLQFGPHNLSQTNFAYLTLRQVEPEDEGLYKCDVTYTTPHAHGKCPSLTYTRVHTLGKSLSVPSPSEYRPLSALHSNQSGMFGGRVGRHYCRNHSSFSVTKQMFISHNPL